MSEPSTAPVDRSSAPGRMLLRHKLTDRLLHWFMAACMFVLLATSLLPIYGIKFSWVTTHWVTGLLLTAAVLLHIIRSLFMKQPSNMLFGIGDAREIIAGIRRDLTGRGPLIKPGKYSPAQKLLHHGVTIIILTAIVTGLLMMVKIDTPLWERDPYWLAEDKWGVIYVLHGFSALFSVFIITVHMYFGIRPEKRIYTHSMLTGWFPNSGYLKYHDPARWPITDKTKE